MTESTTWGAADIGWDGDTVDWGSDNPPAPDYPTSLHGERAPIMLGYLPPYYAADPHTRALIQAEGYESDNLWGFSLTDLPLITLPADAPLWALALQEAAIGVDRSSWTEADRRASLEQRTKPAAAASDALDFIATDARFDRGSLSWDMADTTVTIHAVGADTGKLTEVLAAAQLVVPFHLAVAVSDS